MEQLPSPAEPVISSQAAPSSQPSTSSQAENATQPLSTTYFSDGGFIPEIPSSYVKQIQAGEFFDLAKRLPQNLQRAVTEIHDNKRFQLSVGLNSELKVSKSAQKANTTTIEDGTTAFSVYMKIYIDGYPLKAREILEYIDIIRSAAKYHRQLG